MDAPFSFTARDAARAAQREEAARKDPNRFQIRFRAKPVPAAVYKVPQMLLYVSDMSVACMEVAAFRHFVRTVLPPL